MNILTLIKELKEVQKIYKNIDCNKTYKIEVQKENNQFILVIK